MVELVNGPSSLPKAFAEVIPVSGTDFEVSLRLSKLIALDLCLISLLAILDLTDEGPSVTEEESSSLGAALDVNSLAILEIRRWPSPSVF